MQQHHMVTPAFVLLWLTPPDLVLGLFCNSFQFYVHLFALYCRPRLMAS